MGITCGYDTTHTLIHIDKSVTDTDTLRCITGFYLMDDEWTLQATFAGAISQQIGLDLVQRGQGSATGTTERRQQHHVLLKAN